MVFSVSVVRVRSPRNSKIRKAVKRVNTKKASVFGSVGQQDRIGHWTGQNAQTGTEKRDRTLDKTH